MLPLVKVCKKFFQKQSIMKAWIQLLGTYPGCHDSGEPIDTSNEIFHFSWWPVAGVDVKDKAVVYKETFEYVITEQLEI